MSDQNLRGLKSKAESGTLSSSELDRLVELLEHDELDTRESAAKCLKEYSRDHPGDVGAVREKLFPLLRDSDQSSSRQSDLGEALSQVALEYPLQIEPVAETLFEFTAKPWRFYSFSDAVASIAAESEQTREMLREYVETGSKAERNNALFTFSKVSEATPAALSSLAPMFRKIAEDDSEYLKQRGFAAECFARAPPGEQPLDAATIETLLNTREKAAVDGGLWALRHGLETDRSRPYSDEIVSRVEDLKENEVDDLYLYRQDRELAESIYDLLSEIEDDEFNGGTEQSGTPTKVYSETPTSSTSPTVSFCPSCGTNLEEYDDPAFCISCGTEFS